jgi:hypothetical protein
MIDKTIKTIRISIISFITIALLCSSFILSDKSIFDHIFKKTMYYYKYLIIKIMEKNKNILLFRQRKKLLVLLIILSLSYFLSNLSAQSYISKYEIKGTIVDEKLIPVEFSNIVLINPIDSSIIDGCVSDIDGKFSLKTAFEGKFLLKISFIGYDDCIKSVDMMIALNLFLLINQFLIVEI